MNNFDKIISLIPDPSSLHQEAQKIASEDSEYAEFIPEALPSFDVFKSNDGGGQEGNIAFYKENGKVVAALAYAFDHESELFVGMDSEALAKEQFIFNGVPEVFAPVFGEASPFLWKFEEFPTTFSTVFATAAAWNTDGSWSYADLSDKTDFEDHEPVDTKQLANYFKYSFKPFEFVAEYKADGN